MRAAIISSLLLSRRRLACFAITIALFLSTARGFATKKTLVHIFLYTQSMTAQNIDGKAIAADIRAQLKQELENNNSDSLPGLATLLVGARRDSQTYVNMKKKACVETGLASFGYTFPQDVTEESLICQNSRAQS